LSELDPFDPADPLVLEPETEAPAQPASASAGIVRAAGINSLGNISSRVLGLVRETVVAGTFGASGATSAFDAISSVPKMVYELLVGGMLSAALVPVLSEYATKERRAELEQILSILLSLAGVVLIVVVVLLELGAQWVAPLLVGGFDAELLRTATLLVRIIVPSILIYGLSGIIQAYHYARKRFVYPAMGAPAHNLGLIVAVIFLATKLHIASLSVAVLMAATAQLALQLPGLRGVRLTLCLDWQHPVVRRILRLYAPVVLSIVVSNLGIIIDRNLDSRTVAEAITWMSKATFLIQLPLGLVSMAISLAVLPTLSQIDAHVELDRFKRTFSLGLRLVLVVIIPAAAVLFVLGKPIIELIYQHGEFTPADTLSTWHALRYYLLGLPFAAIDLPLIFAFYAQKDTVTPVIVGILATLLYLAVGPGLAFMAGWGFLGLVIANSVQLIGHAVIMLIAFRQRFQGMGGYGILRATLKASAAALVLAVVSYCSYVVMGRLHLPAGFISRVLVVGVCGGLGGLGFLVSAQFLHIEELDMLWEAIQRKLAPRTA
jgi:putative peptidoglycan lipid II flippase